MAIIACHGKTDLLITFTCNPGWPKIVDNLERHQRWEHRPDLACRVFEGKLKEFLQDFTDRQLYGRVLNYHLVVEFQKRGLSHSHIVFTFVQDDKIHHERDVDALISACINFIISVNQRSKYHRPNNSRIVLLANETLPIDNRHVVPYNSYALAKYNCHINFEVVWAAATIKYLHKYFMKGWDRGSIDVNDENSRVDEMHRYVGCRYVSSTEAAWKLLEFDIFKRSFFSPYIYRATETFCMTTIRII